MNIYTKSIPKRLNGSRKPKERVFPVYERVEMTDGEWLSHGESLAGAGKPIHVDLVIRIHSDGSMKSGRTATNQEIYDYCK